MNKVFPTLVGVFPGRSALVCGPQQSSPRSWGCFPLRPGNLPWVIVFPTLVGVFPKR